MRVRVCVCMCVCECVFVLTSPRTRVCKNVLPNIQKETYVFEERPIKETNLRTSIPHVYHVYIYLCGCAYDTYIPTDTSVEMCIYTDMYAYICIYICVQCIHIFV